MAETQAVLDKWFLRQDIIDQLIDAGEDGQSAHEFGDRIINIAEQEEAEHQTLDDPFDRSVALVFSLVREEELDAWNIDLSQFLKVFTQRVKKDADGLDLPACGRLIRLSWEVLHHQAAILFDRVQREDEEDDWEDEMHFGWEAEYDDEAFFFTNSILQGEADELLPGLFSERVRRDEGRPVTLGELLSAFKVAADEAEELKLREESRIAAQAELADYLKNVGGRMHNEDLEGDIKRCWNALRSACKNARSNKIPVRDVMVELGLILEQSYGESEEGYDDEAKVASFIAGLFLTHRGFASITQEDVPDGVIYLEDLWPNLETFEEVLQATLDAHKAESERIQTQETGSSRHTQALAQRAEEARQKQEEEAAAIEASKLEEESNDEGVEDAEINVDFDSGDKLETHDWLVE